MPYIGRPLNAGNLAVQSGTGDGADTTPIATLDYSVGSSNSIGVYLDGVRQLAGTDFTASGTVLTFTTAPANLVGIDVYFLGLELSIPTPADATVTTAKIAANAVDETKLKDALVADFTEVVIAAGDSILLGDATDSGNTKRDTVQGILDLVPAGGGWGFVSQVASGGSPPTTMSFTNMAAGYDYLYVTGPMLPSTDSTDFWYYLGVAGPTYRTSGYLNGSGNVGSGGGSTGTANTTEMMINDGGGNVGSAADEGIQFMETILLNPAGTTDTHVHTVCSSRDAGGAYNQCITGGLLNAAEAHTSIRFNFSGGTMTGTILQYRRSRT
jgi:hypothetical protein